MKIMQKISLIFLFLLIIKNNLILCDDSSSSSSSEEGCKLNEEFRQCKGCDESCQFIGAMCKVDPNSCKPGCYCKDGYIRNEEGRCVNGTTHCCPKNEYYYPLHKCNAPSNCQITCDTLGQKCNIINIVCANGCYCKPGYARDSKGICIPISKCKKCGKHEIFTEFGSNEESTCLQPYAQNCTDNCISKCVCKPGYIRSKPNGPCIKQNDCQKICGKNEKYSTCGTYCESVCGVVNNKMCITLCKVGCFCKTGFIRDTNGKCISTQQCLDSCKKTKKEVAK